MKKVCENKTDLKALFDFYKEKVKPLYAVIQVDGYLPAEVLFEINAALDHVSRIFTCDQEEEEAISCAKRHLKRSCLDIFKLTVKTTHDQYDELNRMPGLVYLNNGEFSIQMRKAWEEIREAGIAARLQEGKNGYADTDDIPAFEKWEKVFILCEEFRRTYYNHSGKDWANKQAIWDKRKDYLIGGVVGAAISLILSYLYSAVQSWLYAGV